MAPGPLSQVTFVFTVILFRVPPGSRYSASCCPYSAAISSYSFLSASCAFFQWSAPLKWPFACTGPVGQLPGPPGMSSGRSASSITVACVVLRIRASCSLLTSILNS